MADVVASVVGSLALAALLVGCNVMDRRIVFDPCRNQVIRVVSGDRLIFDLDEGPSDGRWQSRCDDSDVEVIIDRSGNGLKGRKTVGVCIRVHRGYDGPSTVEFRRTGGEDRPGLPRKFTITLFKRTGDVACWE